MRYASSTKIVGQKSSHLNFASLGMNNRHVERGSLGDASARIGNRNRARSCRQCSAQGVACDRLRGRIVISRRNREIRF